MNDSPVSDLDKIQSVRQAVPIRTQKRPDLYRTEDVSK